MTWEELNEKHDYDYSGLIECMPCDVKREIAKAWDGGALHPYNATEHVLDRMKVDLDKVDRQYSERFVQKGCSSSNKTDDPNSPKSFADFDNDIGEEIASRAEILAAMDCIIHHLVDESDIQQWESCAVREGRDWHILNELGAVGRREHYTCDAEGMSENEFECIVRTFASIIKAQCFDVKYREGAFDCCHTEVVR